MKDRSRAHPARPTEAADRTDPPAWRNRLGWRIGIGIIAPAAAGLVAWSLYVVAHNMYGVPWFLAALVAACFDGIAIACLHLASEAVREGRSALGPRLVTLLQAGISMYLNHLHAEHIDGGIGATLMFAAPTAGLLLLFDQSWAATRARHRIARGEHPMRWPVFGWLGWLLAGEQAWSQTKARAVAHVTGTASGEAETEPAAGREAPELIASELSAMTPRKAIRIMHEARPELTLAQLADVLRQYGQDVTELDVAIVLDRVPRPSGYTLTRDDAPPHHYGAPQPQQLVITVQQPEALTAAAPPPPAPPERPAENAPAPGSSPIPNPDEQRRADRIVDEAVAGAGLSKADAVRRVREALPRLTSTQVAEQLTRCGFDKVTDGYVRTVNSRDRNRPAPKPAAAPAPPARSRPTPNGPYL
ncbi:DUF2637 domain-containing protein [Streptomyces boncukensis]|uniref:DUF2637 domain-containing protein n=1 Tax=Streptomyces boncukensis TaxID=2711219 RepID=A0A6G4WT61_9ACTN|nr:DUF2637 domain-containing protein [Streptomyces boncukensis]